MLVTAVAAAAFEFVEMPANRWIRNRVANRLRTGSRVLARAAAA